MVCPKCHARKMRRIKREGILHTRLAPIFGYFPWRCSSCGKMQLLRKRGEQTVSQDGGSPQRKTLRSSAGQLQG